jgi:hypothetical protein
MTTTVAAASGEASGECCGGVGSHRSRSTKAVKRSAIPDIRKTMLERGALLFMFTKPAGVLHKPEHVRWFEQMQALGFLITTSGCMIPYDNFSGSSKSRPKGHKISAYYFFGEPPAFGDHEHGWPTEAQVSHLCHRKECINPSHLVYEPQWRNLKRNYCGEKGECDCGVQPRCVATYHNERWRHQECDTYITYETANYKRAVADLVPGQRFVILGPGHYSSVDTKRSKRNERLKGKRKKPASSQARQLDDASTSSKRPMLKKEEV